jgi:hypothetical protein
LGHVTVFVAFLAEFEVNPGARFMGVAIDFFALRSEADKQLGTQLGGDTAELLAIFGNLDTERPT